MNPLEYLVINITDQYERLKTIKKRDLFEHYTPRIYHMFIDQYQDYLFHNFKVDEHWFRDKFQKIKENLKEQFKIADLKPLKEIINKLSGSAS